MDWPPEPLAPPTPFREVCWRLVGPSARVLTCEIVAIETGLELRCDYGGDDLIRSQFAEQPAR